jgi:sigma-B regulation protein RsbU (phosphoserine phosphatase)
VIIGFMASFLSFFLIDDYCRTRLVPVFFPHGRLAEVPGTVKISIHRKIRVLYSAGTAFSMAILMGTLLLLQWQMEDALVSAVDFGRGIVVFTGVLFAIFLVVALGLHLMVTKTISAPIKAMMALVRKVRRGEFQHKVQVVSNDELGILGDGMNEMTAGLVERERMRRSLDMAREVQQALLPRHPPAVSGLDIACISVYCDETGGDYFDFIDHGRESAGSVSVVIGDVAGHGISAALLMATARAFLRQRSVQPGSLARVVSDVNRLLVPDVEESGGFMTLFYLTIDGKGRKLNWVRAGHDPAIFYDPAADVFEPLHGAGMALGVNPDAHYEHCEKDNLAKGQIIVLATDGVWEARNSGGKMFGKDSIYRVVRQKAAVSAGEILAAVFDDLNRFAGAQRAEDDMTMVVIKVD